MWPFSIHRQLQDSAIFHGFTDWHSHILPGVDDGFQSIEKALALLQQYEELGISTVWLTPHIMEDIPNTTAHLRERFAELQAAYTGNVKLHLAAENMLDKLFEERLEHDDLLPIGNEGDHLLVETSCFNPPMQWHDIFRRIQSKGYHPILAHPERYTYMDEKNYRLLKDMGVKFQLNLSSVAGLYGQQVKKKALFLLQQRSVSFLGTDVHHLISFRRLREARLSPKSYRLLDPKR